MHYTQQPSRVMSRTNSAATLMYTRMQGFITAPLLREELAGWDRAYGERLPSNLLIDLRDVAGYGDKTAEIAREWLGRAGGRGVRRIAVVALSSVVRTVVRLVAPEVAIGLRCFPGEDPAIEWLEGRVEGRPSAASSRRLEARP